MVAVATADKGKIAAQSEPIKKAGMARIGDIRGDLLILSANKPALFRIS